MRRALILAVVLSASVAFGEAVNPPARMSAHKLDRSVVAGLVSSYDDSGFQYVDAKKQEHQVTWEELDAANALVVYQQILGKGTAEKWMAAGNKLLAMKNGRVPAQKAFERAVRLDPSVREDAEAAMRGEKKAATNPATTEPGGPAKGGERRAGSGKEWPELSDKEQAAAVDENKQFAAQVRQEMAPNLAMYETQRFLFCTDLQGSESRRWAGVLDQMYARLAGIFGVPATENIWRGKALVLVFGQREMYEKFEQQYFQKDATKKGGTCNELGNGDVRIAFYRGSDDHAFARTLVHECTHGFMYRYRAQARMPSWVDEGLAEYVAEELVSHAGLKAASDAEAKGELQAHKDLGNFFTMQDPANWEYPIARTMCEFMIRTNAKGYVGFVNGIKDGMTAEESLQKNYGASEEQLLAAYARWMGIAGVTASGREIPKED